MKKRCLLAIVVSLGVLVASAPADQITLNAIKDTWVQSINPNTNYGQDDDLWMGRGQYWGLGTIRGLFEFDLSPLPSDPDLIISATFSAYQYGTMPAAGGLPVNVHYLTGTWGEDTVTWNNQPGYHATVWAGADVGNSFHTDWIDWNVTNLVKDQVGGDSTHMGWLFKASNEGGAGASRLGYFRSDEYSNPAYRPMLVVEYIPEPATLSLLALGALLATRRRR